MTLPSGALSDLLQTREPYPVIPGTKRQKIKNRKTSHCCPCQDDSIGMPTLHIGPAVSEKTGMVNKGFSFIVMGDYVLYNGK